MALWRSSVRSRSAPPSSFKFFHQKVIKRSRLIETTLSTFLLICFGCSHDTMEEEAVEILSLGNEDDDSSIEKSADGLQFSISNDDTDKNSTVGFSKEGEVSYKGDFKKGKPHGLWTTYFPDGKPRWEGYKKEGVNHGSFTMWYDNGKKRIKGFMKMVLNMDYPLRGIKMESSGSKDLITLVIPSEHGNHGMKKVLSCQKFFMQRFLK